MSALARQPQRDPPADALARTGDDGDFTRRRCSMVMLHD